MRAPLGTLITIFGTHAHPHFTRIVHFATQPRRSDAPNSPKPSRPDGEDGIAGTGGGAGLGGQQKESVGESGDPTSGEGEGNSNAGGQTQPITAR